KSASEIMRLFAEIHQTGTTIMLVTHDAKIAARTERVLFMIDGKITGEYLLGSYNEDPEELKEREEKLNSWLTEKEVADMKTAEPAN
ncbi:MAG: hypothetical protein K9K78_05775, partial [Spirochaetales bacterium]|nr:hypothetical protein [Spirochaetales bacterium]